MAALIENNEGHIEHMVAVVSPFPPSSRFFFLSSLTLCLPGSPRLPQTKGFGRTLPEPGKDARQRKDVVKVVVLFFFFSLSFRQVRVHSVDEKGERPANQYVANASPAETSGGESTGLSIVLISSAFVLHASADIRSSRPRSRLSLRAARVEAPAYFNIGHLTDGRPAAC